MIEQRPCSPESVDSIRPTRADSALVLAGISHIELPAPKQDSILAEISHLGWPQALSAAKLDGTIQSAQEARQTLTFRAQQTVSAIIDPAELPYRYPGPSQSSWACYVENTTLLRLRLHPRETDPPSAGRRAQPGNALQHSLEHRSRHRHLGRLEDQPSDMAHQPALNLD